MSVNAYRMRNNARLFEMNVHARQLRGHAGPSTMSNECCRNALMKNAIMLVCNLMKVNAKWSLNARECSQVNMKMNEKKCNIAVKCMNNSTI